MRRNERERGRGLEKAEGEERRRFKKISKDKDEHGQRGEERSFDRWPGRGVRAGRWRHRRGNDQWEKSPRCICL